MLDERQYYRGVWVFTLEYGALMSTLLQTFLEMSDGNEVLTSEGQETINTTHALLSESGGLPKRTSDAHW